MARKQTSSSSHKQSKSNNVSGSSQKSVITLIFESALEIIEDRASVEYSQFTYYSLIIVYLFQLGGYIFPNAGAGLMTETKLLIITRIAESSTGTFYVFLIEQDTLMTILFVCFHSIMYASMGYIALMTIVRKYFHQSNFLSRTRHMRATLNRVFNVYFLIYLWTLSIPNLELNAGFLACGKFGFLHKYNDNCDSKPQFYAILSVFGFIFTVTTILVMLFFFRNYEFCEPNYMKRRFNPAQGSIVLLHLIVIFNFFTESFSQNISYTSMNIISVIYVYDSIVNKPYSNYSLSRFQTTTALLLALYMGLITVRQLNHHQLDKEIFYACLMATAIFFGVATSLGNYHVYQIERITPQNFKKMSCYLDRLLELMYELGVSQLMNMEDRYRLSSIILYHRKYCTNLNCSCHWTNSFTNEKDIIDIDELNRLIDSMFLWGLQHPSIIKNQDQLEHLSLKFITYLVKYRNNSFRAYYELKCILSQHEASLSLYFRTLANVLTAKIEERIHTREAATSAKDLHDEAKLRKHHLDLVFKADKIEQILLPRFVKLIEHKKQFYQQILSTDNNVATIDQFSEVVEAISKEAISITSEYKKAFQGANLFQLSKSFKVLKLQQLYQIVIQNDMYCAVKNELQMLELNRTDRNKLLDAIHNTNVIRGDVLTLRMSLAQNRGELISMNMKTAALFFGFSTQDAISLKSVNQLMPSMFRLFHNNILDNFIQRGSIAVPSRSSLVVSDPRITTFAIDARQFIFPVHLYVSYNFEYLNDAILCGTVVKIDTTKAYIIFDQVGKIFGITAPLFNQIFKSNIMTLDPALANMDTQTFYNRFSIFSLFPALSKILSSTSKDRKSLGGLSNESWENDIGVSRRVTNICIRQNGKFRIPKNHQEVSNKINAINFIMNIRQGNSSQQSQQSSSLQSPQQSNPLQVNSAQNSKQLTKPLDILQFYNQLKRVFKRKSKDNEKLEQVLNELNIVFNLNFTEYRVSQSEKEAKVNSFYTMEIIDVSGNNDKQNELDQTYMSETPLDGKYSTFGTSETSRFNSIQNGGDDEIDSPNVEITQGIPRADLLAQREARGINTNVPTNADQFDIDEEFIRAQQQILYTDAKGQSQLNSTRVIRSAREPVSSAQAGGIFSLDTSVGAGLNNTTRRVLLKDTHEQLDDEPVSMFESIEAMALAGKQNQQFGGGSGSQFQLQLLNQQQQQQQIVQGPSSQSIAHGSTLVPNDSVVSPPLDFSKQTSFDPQLYMQTQENLTNQNNNLNNGSALPASIESGLVNQNKSMIQTTNHENLSIIMPEFLAGGNGVGLLSPNSVTFPTVLSPQQINQSSSSLKPSMWKKQNLNSSKQSQPTQPPDKSKQLVSQSQKLNDRSQENISDLAAPIDNNDEIDQHNQFRVGHMLEEKVKHQLQEHLQENENSSQQSLGSLLKRSNQRWVHFIIERTKSHSASFTIKTIFGMAIVLYASLMAVYVNFVSTELQWMSDQFNDKIEVSIIVQQYANISMMGLLLLEANMGNVNSAINKPDRLASLKKEITISIQQYLDNFNSFVPKIAAQSDILNESIDFENYSYQEHVLLTQTKYQFLLQTTENAIGIAFPSEDYEVDQDDLLFFLANFIRYTYLEYEMDDFIDNVSTERSDSIDSSNTIMFIFSISTILIFPFLCVNLVNVVKRFQEKVLQTIARITTTECNATITQLTQIHFSLTDPNAAWLRSDLIRLAYFQDIQMQQNHLAVASTNPATTQTAAKAAVASAATVAENADMSNSKKKQSQVSHGHHHAKKHQQSASHSSQSRKQMLYSSLVLQRLSKWKFFSVIMVICFVIVAYFSSINYAMRDYLVSFDSPAVTFDKTSHTIDLVLQLNAITENYVSSRKIRETYPKFTSFLSKDFTEFYAEKLEFLIMYNRNFSETIEGLNAVSSTQANEIKELFQLDLCTTHSKECEISEYTKNLYSHGISGILNHYIEFYSRNDQFEANDLSDEDYLAYITAYHESDSYQALVTGSFDTVNYTLGEFRKKIGNLCSDFTQNLRTLLLWYMNITGVILFFLLVTLLFICELFTLRILNTFANALTLVPQSKMHEESTIQLLKAFLKS